MYLCLISGVVLNGYKLLDLIVKKYNLHKFVFANIFRILNILNDISNLNQWVHHYKLNQKKAYEQNCC